MHADKDRNRNVVQKHTDQVRLQRFKVNAHLGRMELVGVLLNTFVYLRLSAFICGKGFSNAT
jgi:hypothetical protein